MFSFYFLQRSACTGLADCKCFILFLAGFFTLFFLSTLIYRLSGSWIHDLPHHLALIREGGAIWVRAHWPNWYIDGKLNVFLILLLDKKNVSLFQFYVKKWITSKKMYTAGHYWNKNVVPWWLIFATPIDTSVVESVDFAKTFYFYAFCPLFICFPELSWGTYVSKNYGMSGGDDRNFIKVCQSTNFYLFLIYGGMSYIF